MEPTEVSATRGPDTERAPTNAASPVHLSLPIVEGRHLSRRSFADWAGRHKLLVGAIAVYVPGLTAGVAASLGGVDSVREWVLASLVVGVGVAVVEWLRHPDERAYIHGAVTVGLASCVVVLLVWRASTVDRSEPSISTVSVSPQGDVARVAVSIDQPADGGAIASGKQTSFSGKALLMPANAVLWLVAYDDDYYIALGSPSVTRLGSWSINLTLGTTQDPRGTHYQLLALVVTSAEEDHLLSRAASAESEGQVELTASNITPFVAARASYTAR